MAANSASNAVCCPPRLRAPSPLLSFVTSQPKPAASRKEPSVQAWHTSLPSLGLDHGVLSRTLGELVSVCRPSLTSWLLLLASANHLGIRCRLESSVAFGGRIAFLNTHHNTHNLSHFNEKDGWSTRQNGEESVVMEKLHEIRLNHLLAEVKKFSTNFTKRMRYCRRC
jgi:hypothetical protein